jgi:coproporphyrinogen dehydrogenase
MDSNHLNLNVNDFMDLPITGLDELKASPKSMRSNFEIFILKIQKEICNELERLENLNQDEKLLRKFRVDSWQREGNGGGGISCVLQNGLVFEKAGVNVSVVFGPLPKAAADQMRQRGKVFEQDTELNFFAAGISSVIHPQNPNVPTIHFNYRYFEVEESKVSL